MVACQRPGRRGRRALFPLQSSLIKEAALQAQPVQQSARQRRHDPWLASVRAGWAPWVTAGSDVSGRLLSERAHTLQNAEKVSSLGKDWHKFCLKCERCNKTLTPGGHAEHDGKPFCHKPCYATLFGPKGVNIGGAGSYIYEKPQIEGQTAPGPIEHPAKVEERKVNTAPPKGPSKASSVTTFTGEPNMCPRCGKRVYFAEKVTSLGKDWHRPCLRCERCSKTLTPGGHAEHDGQPYCHKPCYGILFGPKGVNTGAVGSYIYDKDPEAKNQP
ncbi:cysteine-rich protein 2 isoform X2 [Phalacrocorax carbo]|uniref:cysteine-rich protein 2 isoform X2 n=1 Tax=Phalacrocorax carbo TaxID=9209 RepID=UPI003119EE59